MDSFTFCQFINNVKLPDNHVLVSFDVVSLFTCIPRELVRQTIGKRWQHIEKHTEICLDIFQEIVHFCLECSFFSYKGQYYKQIFGTAMGNPLSSPAADLVMETLLETVIQLIPFRIPLVKKYMDDLVLALPDDKVEEVLCIFNQYNNNLQFTCEIERDRRLPFLDMVLVRQNDQSIRTEWYCKPMASGRFIDYFSCHPLHMKTNMVANFIKRAREFSTNLSDAAVNNIIDTHLKLNHYPTSFRHCCLNKRNAVHTDSSAAETTPVVYKPMVYVPGLTSRFMKILREDFPQVTLATRNERTVKMFFSNTKDVVEPAMRTNVIYRISCNDCRASYVGLTTTYLKQRVAGHRSDRTKMGNLTDAISYGDPLAAYEMERLKEKTALVNHSITLGHQFGLENAVVIDQHRRKTALAVLEVCHIINTDHTVNKRSDTDGLSSMYAGILHTLKNRSLTRNAITQTPTETIAPNTQ